MKIAFLSTYDPRDRRSWSGTIYYMAQALQKHCGDVSYIAPIDAPKQEAIAKSINKGSQLFLKKRFAYQSCILVARKLAKVAKKRLAGQNFDLIVAPVGETVVAFLETNIPILLVEDATYGLLIDYHQDYSNLLKRSFRELLILEHLALKKASIIVSSSTWAAQSAIEDYGTDPAKIHVVPFGANLDEIPPREADFARKQSDRCSLLFLAAGWARKGGNIAFDTLLKLEELGIQAELVVCGCTPPTEIAHKRMKVIPFLDKNDEQQRKELEHLLLAADFLLVPTRNDCTPIVFSEASAFGLPVITTRTGGVPEVVRDGENGFLLPYEARGDAYAEVIARVYRDDQRYAELVRASRFAFEDHLNWDAWGIAVKQILTHLLDNQNSYRDSQTLVAPRADKF